MSAPRSNLAAVSPQGAASGGSKGGLARDERGQTSVEYMLIVAAFGIPLVWVMRVLLEVLTEHYRMISFLETLPYP